MLNAFLSQHASAILIAAVLVFAMARVVSYRKNARRREKPDPPAIFGPIRGMYVCYQCDTIFNTTQCPFCHEEASIPLIHLTGSITEDERMAEVTNRLSVRVTRKLPEFQKEQAVQPPPASLPQSSNGDASAAPVRFLFAPERGRELS